MHTPAGECEGSRTAGTESCTDEKLLERQPQLEPGRCTRLNRKRSSVREQPGNGRRQALCKEGPAINHRTGGKGPRALNKNYSRTLPELEKDYFHIKKNNRKQTGKMLCKLEKVQNDIQ